MYLRVLNILNDPLPRRRRLDDIITVVVSIVRAMVIKEYNIEYNV